jgi:hypothetical protein
VADPGPAASELPDASVLPPPPDGPPPDGPPPGEGQLNYRITRLGIDTPGADENTAFASLMNQVLPIAFAGGVFSPDPLYILVRFSTVEPNSSGVIVTFCQGEKTADDTLACTADPPEVSSTGTINASGEITTEPADFAFNVATPAGAIGLTLANFTMNGLLESGADNGPVNAPDSSTGTLLDGTFTAQLPADDLCAITLSNPLIGSFCDGTTTVNLLDLLDGPEANCGQDTSADTTACTASTDTATHNPPVDVAGELRFDTTGTFDLTGIIFAQ